MFITVPTAKPITFAKINFNVIGLNETKDIVKLIEVSLRALLAFDYRKSSN